MKRGRSSSAGGYTIIELVVVLAILGVLAAALLPLGETMVRMQQEHALRRALWEIRDALDEYKRAADHGTIERTTESGYPPDLETLVKGVRSISQGAGGQEIYFLRRLPRDPFGDPSIDASATWSLRSYQSPPDRPAPGADVYDVRSSSHKTAIDGSTYATW